jgi:hypothetical protein
MSPTDPDKALQRRIWATAILAGYRGLGDLAKAMNEPGLSHASLRTITYESPGLASKLAAISAHASSVGASIPTVWLRDGFASHEGELPDRPAMMSDLTALEQRLKP